MSKLSKVQVLLAILLIFSGIGSYANNLSGIGSSKAMAADSEWCYTSQGWIKCP